MSKIAIEDSDLAVEAPTEMKAEYALALGNRRAIAVKDFLVSHGVNAELINTLSLGVERPKYPEAADLMNNRVAIIVDLR